MKSEKIYLGLAFGNSIFLGIILLLALGVKDATLIAITFSPVIMFIIVFLIKPGLKIKVIRHKNPTTVRFELSDSTPKE